MKLPAMPVRSGRDATLNFDKLSVVAPTFVNALPFNPVDGQEVYYQTAAMAAAGVVWHLRYRAASTSAYKWEFIGGSDFYALPGSVPIKASTATANVPKSLGEPTVTLPLAGDYDAHCTGTPVNNTAKAAQLTTFSVGVGSTGVGTIAFGGLAVLQASAASGFYIPITTLERVINQAAGVVLTPIFQVSDALQVDWYNISFHVRPVRVG